MYKIIVGRNDNKRLSPNTKTHKNDVHDRPHFFWQDSARDWKLGANDEADDDSICQYE